MLLGAGLTLCALGCWLVLGAGRCTIHLGLGGAGLFIAGLVSFITGLIRWQRARGT